MIPDPRDAHAQRVVIVGAIDESATSLDVIKSAASLAQTLHGAELHLIHVVEPIADADTPAAAASYLTPLLEGGRRVTEEARDHAHGYFSGRIVQHVAIGTPWREVLQLAADLHADVIVVGMNRKRTLERWLLGSEAEEVVRRAACTVLVARSKAYDDDVPEIEPPCDACLLTQQKSAGSVLWCKQHEHRAPHRRSHVYEELPQTFGVGSMLIRP